MHHIDESRQQSDVDLERGTLIVARSHLREQTKGGDAAVLPIPAPLWPWIRYQLNRAPGPLLFPAPDGSQRARKLKGIRRRWVGGRCRIRPCDPCHVNRLKAVGRPTAVLSSLCILSRSRGAPARTFVKRWQHLSRSWVQIGSNV